MAKIGILGAGSWGTALAILLDNNRHQVQVWSALAEEIQMLSQTHEHSAKLPGVKMVITTGPINGGCALEYGAMVERAKKSGVAITEAMTDAEVLAAIEDFEELGKTDPLFKKLDEACKKNRGLWNAEAERILFEHFGVEA